MLSHLCGLIFPTCKRNYVFSQKTFSSIIQLMVALSPTSGIVEGETSIVYRDESSPTISVKASTISPVG